jgi:hypothetical protein
LISLWIVAENILTFPAGYIDVPEMWKEYSFITGRYIMLPNSQFIENMQEYYDSYYYSGKEPIFLYPWFFNNSILKTDQTKAGYFSYKRKIPIYSWWICTLDYILFNYPSDDCDIENDVNQMHAIGISEIILMKKYTQYFYYTWTEKNQYFLRALSILTDPKLSLYIKKKYESDNAIIFTIN